MTNGSNNFYDGYNYLDFWLGRQYEDEADKMAVSRLLSLVPGVSRKLIDVGAGIGRMVSLYEEKCEQFILLDSSAHQLAEAKNIRPLNPKGSTLIGDGENIPLPNGSLDTALCVRVFHHLQDPTKIVQEINRILEVGGYLILEIPNKLHFKNRINGYLGKIDWDILSETPINRAVNHENVTFVNHHPQTIIDLLKSNGFEILEILSVSNFRSSFLKKILPTSLLIFLEKLSQNPLARFWFGPSLYFLARKTS